MFNHSAFGVAGQSRSLLCRKAGLLAAFSLAFVESANAHVKWFCAYDVAGNPRGLENVLCQDFEWLAGLAILGLTAGCLFEQTSSGGFMLRSLDRVTGPLRENTETVVRATCAFFFISLWAIGGIILTPELKTTSTAIPLLQLAIAACLATRYTMPLSGLGIFALFGIGVSKYGLFHLADYPIFLGIATYLIFTGLQKSIYGIRPLNLMRYATAITLMWASVEKWAYPEWTFPLFLEHPSITLGFDSELYMRAAGIIEFVLAFSLLWTPLVRRVGALILAGMFIGACFEFGKIDMIGHSGIIVVLFAIIADNAVQAPEKERRSPLLAPVGFSAALAVTLAVYYAGHAASYSTAAL